jgi:3-hydroxybutyryl-CoA dehydratase
MSDVAPVSRTITQEQLRAYADASGDHNPIHVDEEYARATPFGGTIAHGMLVASLIGEMMYAAHGRTWSESGRLRLRFRAPTRPGDTVTASAEAAGDAHGARRDYAVRCTNQAGDVVIDGRASVTVAT